MTTLSNEIVLRPRFQMTIEHPKESLLQAFEKRNQAPYLIKRVDDHVFIKFNSEHSHFWSPQLHLEINEEGNSMSKIYGLFGPNPTLWTFFMFLHFGVAVIFILLGVWAYSNWSLNESFAYQLAGMVFMLVLWFALYTMGRIGKAKGKPQMLSLYEFMNFVIKE